MTVKIYSKKMMKALLEMGKVENVAIISFYDPKRNTCENDVPIDFTDKCERVMQIPIYDVDISALSDFGLTEQTYFPEADALAEFIYKAKADGIDIICQCEYGQSRSAGCAAAILQHFARKGINVFADYRYYPNQLIYHKVFDALNKRKEQKNDY